jgi:hypothetical protein
VVGGVLLAIGIPMIVHNGKRLPLGTTSATLRPTPSGLSLSF